MNEVNQTCHNVENVNAELSPADMSATPAVPCQIQRLMNGTIGIGETGRFTLLPLPFWGDLDTNLSEE